MKLRLTKIVDSVEQTTYPNEYGAVMNGEAFWFPHPINIVGYYNKFYSFNKYEEIDMNHPRCYNCGKFMKKNWKDWLCQNCQGER